jgi:hypothetical protein
MWLINTLAGIPVSINYDWSDGSGSAWDCESHFGSVTLDASPAGQPFTPKPKWVAALRCAHRHGQRMFHDNRFGSYMRLRAHTHSHIHTHTHTHTHTPTSVLANTFSHPRYCHFLDGRYLAALALQAALGGFARAEKRVQPTSIAPTTVLARDVFVLPFVNDTGTPGFAVWSNNSVAVSACAGAPVPLREDCGHFGIDKDACLSPSNPKGPSCCWEPNEPSVGGPQCYNVRKPAQVEVTFAAPAKQCWAVSDFLGNPVPSPGNRVCATDAGEVTVTTGLASTSNTTSVPVSTPVYLVPMLE